MVIQVAVPEFKPRQQPDSRLCASNHLYTILLLYYYCKSVLSSSACLPSSPKQGRAGYLISFTDKFMAFQSEHPQLATPSFMNLSSFLLSLIPFLHFKEGTSSSLLRRYSSWIPCCLLEGAVL